MIVSVNKCMSFKIFIFSFENTMTLSKIDEMSGQCSLIYLPSVQDQIRKSDRSKCARIITDNNPPFLIK